MGLRAQDLTLIQRAALLSGQSEWETRRIVKAGIEPIVLSDGPNGIRRQTGSGDHLGLGASKPATCFPTAGTVANSWDPKETEKMGKALGEEARTLGVQVLLGPGINMKRNPLCGRNFEYYSEDPQLAGYLAAGFIRGIQSQGVSACPKHFAVNSQELRRQASNSVIDERTMREIYMTAFEIAVKEARPWTLTTSYNMVNGVYAHENKHLLADILRGEWGYTGMVVSDWGGSNNIAASAAAGASLEMPAAGLASVREIMQAVESGKLSEKDVTERAQEVLDLIGRTQPSGQQEDGFLTDRQITEHHRIAREIAEKSIVLLKNEPDKDGAPVLPIRKGVRLAVIGDMAQTARYQGSGSSKVNAARVDNLLDELSRRDGITVSGYAQGYDRQGASHPGLAAEAAVLAHREDVDELVVCMGLDERSESEGLDRSTMQIPRAQVSMLEELKKAGKPIIIVLVSGSSVETDWLEGTQAAVYIGLSGQAGACAAANVLMGDVNPSGHLAETWPLRYEDVPSAGNFPSADRDSVYREGPFIGYRYYSTAGIPVRYPFGYGLSYSAFEYNAIRADDDGVSVTVRNTSQTAGDTVAQMYVGRSQDTSGVLRAVRELKGFRRVHLEPGESKDIRFSFDGYTFRHFDTQTGSWQVESGAWDVWVGTDADTLPLHITHVVRGTADPGVLPEQFGHYRGADIRNLTDGDVAYLLGHRQEKYDNHGVFQAEDIISSWSRSRSWVARMIVRILERRAAAVLRKTGSPDLNMLFTLNMPARAIAKMTHGMVSPQMVREGILDIPNKHFWRGIGHLISGYAGNQIKNKQTHKEIEE